MNIIESIRKALRVERPNVPAMEDAVAKAQAELDAASLAFGDSATAANEARVLAARETVFLAETALAGAKRRAEEKSRREAEEAREAAEKAFFADLETFKDDAAKIPAMIADLVELHMRARRMVDAHTATLENLRRQYRERFSGHVSLDIPSEPAFRAIVRETIQRELIDKGLHSAEGMRGRAVGDWLASGGI